MKHIGKKERERGGAKHKVRDRQKQRDKKKRNKNIKIDKKKTGDLLDFLWLSHLRQLPGLALCTPGIRGKVR